MDNPSLGWASPNIMGGSHDSGRGKSRERGDRGRGVDFERVGDGMELDQGFSFREVGHANHVRSLSFGGRGATFGGRGCARGSRWFSEDEGRGTAGGQGSARGWGLAALADYLSTKQFYSLMENGENDVDGCGEDDSMGMVVQLSPGVNTSFPQDGDGEIEGQAIIFQGRPSSSSVMNLSCWLYLTFSCFGTLGELVTQPPKMF